MDYVLMMPKEKLRFEVWLMMMDGTWFEAEAVTKNGNRVNAWKAW